MNTRTASDWLLIGIAVLATGVQVLLAYLAREMPAQDRFDDPLIRQSAIVPTALWFIAMLTGRRPHEVWLLGALTFLIHVMIAFHVGHRWSHSVAMAHVERASGFGPGIFVSYAFGIVWLIDAVWRHNDPDRYRRRPRCQSRLILGFLAFVVFNATVIYGGELARILGSVAFGLLGLRIAFLKWSS